MKRTIRFSFAIACFATAFAQKQTHKIVLKKNEQLEFVSTVKGSTTMDAIIQKMDISMNVGSTKKVVVKKTSKDNYEVDLTTTKIKMDISLLDEKKKFDSEDKTDTTGDMQDFRKEINVPKGYLLSLAGKTTLIDTAMKAEDNASGNPLSDLLGKAMGAANNDDASLESYFMLIPAEKKLNDTWSDTTQINTTKIINTYTWDSTDANIAIIKLQSKVTNVISTEIAELNTALDATINSNITELRKVDIASGIIIHKTSNAIIDGSAEMMGMPLPITGTTESTTTLISTL